jgi:hypothetical protein
LNEAEQVLTFFTFSEAYFTSPFSKSFALADVAKLPKFFCEPGPNTKFHWFTSPIFSALKSC